MVDKPNVVKGEITTPDEQYVTCCVVCGKMDHLVMLGHRVEGKLVGWIFTCLQCYPEVVGKKILVDIGDVL